MVHTEQHPTYRSAHTHRPRRNHETQYRSHSQSTPTHQSTNTHLIGRPRTATTQTLLTFSSASQIFLTNDF